MDVIKFVKFCDLFLSPSCQDVTDKLVLILFQLFLCVILFSRDFIVDSLSVERNHVLVRINLIGGPQERILPSRALDKVRIV